MEVASGSTMAPVVPVLTHAARTTVRKNLYEEIVQTAEALKRQSSNENIIEGCSQCIALYTARIDDIKRKRKQGRRDRKRRAIARSMALIAQLEDAIREVENKFGPGQDDDDTEDDENLDGDWTDWARHEEVKEFLTAWGSVHNALQETGGNAISELQRVDALLCKDMPLPKGSVSTWLSAYEEYKKQALTTVHTHDGPIVDGDI